MKVFGFQLVLKQFTHANICKVKLLQLLSMNVLPPRKSSSSVVINIRREVKKIRAELISPRKSTVMQLALKQCRDLPYCHRQTRHKLGVYTARLFALASMMMIYLASPLKRAG